MIAASGHLVTDDHAPAWWVVADIEGTEGCVATGMGAAASWLFAPVILRGGPSSDESTARRT